MQVLSTPQGAIQVPSMPQILCDFNQGGLSPWEEDIALKSLNITGLPDSEAVPKTNRLSVFDTETWQLSSGADDDLRQFVEHRLMSDPMFGQDYISAEEQRHPVPWPRYDEVAELATMLEFLNMLGYDRDPSDVEKVRLYEHQNQKRPEFLQALEDLQAKLSPSETVTREQEVIHA